MAKSFDGHIYRGHPMPRYGFVNFGPPTGGIQSGPQSQSIRMFSIRWFFFIFFFVSGFCGVLYELIWLRLAMAQFGVTSAMVSIVLATFMGGLGLGSWVCGSLIRRWGSRVRNPIRLYALTEFLIGISAILVPHELLWGRRALEMTGISASSVYYGGSFLCTMLTLVPWCACMGATIPIAMLAIRKGIKSHSPRSFSFLYLANVLGAVAGATIPLLLIEILGFRGTLHIGAVLNGMIALLALALSFRLEDSAVIETSHNANSGANIEPARNDDSRLLILLFMSGMTTMGIEVIWSRQFTPYLGTMVYTFAAILTLYLASTSLGSQKYQRWSRRPHKEFLYVWPFIGLAALLSLISADPQVWIPVPLRLLMAILPFSALLGFVTPMLVDLWSLGDPERAGKAYAVNVAGCIVGPLLAGFFLLPIMNERWALFALAAPWLIVGALPKFVSGISTARPLRQAWSIIVIFGALAAVSLSRGFEDIFKNRVELRDHTASVISTGTGMEKQLLINGIGITYLTPITKFMAHMPLAFLDHPPQSSLVVCFGMGTTFRSLLSWNIQATAVELVPSVPLVFGYYHSDGPKLLQSSLAHLVIDDGRRYLERTDAMYDVITIDPPPPVSAAGSSLLYSKEFYAVTKRRLRPDGMLQQWLPYGDAAIQSSIARSLKKSFTYVRVFHSVTGLGFHFLASNHPIAHLSAEELVRRMPGSAVRDLMEWGPKPTPQLQFSAVLATEFSIDEMIARSPNTPDLEDDRPVNEYYLLRPSADQGSRNPLN